MDTEEGRGRANALPEPEVPEQEVELGFETYRLECELHRECIRIFGYPRLTNVKAPE